jgi:hypothetical protein
MWSEEMDGRADHRRWLLWRQLMRAQIFCQFCQENCAWNQATTIL